MSNSSRGADASGDAPGAALSSCSALSLAGGDIARHTFTTCCCNSRTQGIEYNIFRLSVWQATAKTTHWVFCSFQEALAAFCHHPLFRNVAGTVRWLILVFYSLQQIRQPFFFFFFKFENTEVRLELADLLTTNKKLQV